MKKALIILSIISSFTGTQFAQENYELIWDNTHQADNDTGGLNHPVVVADDSGNVYLFGYAGSVEVDILCKKFDETGEILWELEYDSGYQRREYFKNILFDSEGNLVLGINTYTLDFYPYGREITIIKISPSGEVILDKKYRYNNNPFHFANLSLDNEDNMYIYGGTKENFESSTSSKSVIAKLNADGMLLWEQSLYPHAFLFFKTVSDSSILVIGEKSAPNKYYRYNLTSNGQIIDSLSWLKNGINLIGTFNSQNIPYGLTTNSYGLISFDELGGIDWSYEKPVTFSENFPPYDIIRFSVQDENFNTYNVGTYNSALDTTGLLISKINAHGDLIWEDQQNGLGGEISYPTGLKFENEKILISGFAQNISGDYDYLIYKYTKSGELLTTITFNSVNQEADDQAYSIDYTSEESIIVTGFVRTIPWPADPKYVTQKYGLVTGVSNRTESTEGVVCSPNPFTDYFSISVLREHASKGIINIYSSGGDLLLSKPAMLNEGDNQLFFSGTGLPEGLLLVELKIDNKTVASKKVVKMD